MLVWLREQSDGYPVAGGAPAYQSWRVSSLWGVSLHLPQVCLLPSVYWLSFLQINFLCLSQCICPEILYLKSVQFLRWSTLYHLTQLQSVRLPSVQVRASPVSWGWRGRRPCSRSGGSFQRLMDLGSLRRWRTGPAVIGISRIIIATVFKGD